MKTGSSRFSLLTRNQQIIFSIGFSLGILMVINTLYLLLASHWWGIGKNTQVLPMFYQAMLVVHLLMGILFVGLALGFILVHLLKILRKKNPRAWMRVSGSILATALVSLLVTGFFILEESNSRANFWIFAAHQALAALLVLGYFLHRFLSRVKPAVPDWIFRRKAKIAAASALCIFLAMVVDLQEARSETAKEPAQVPSANAVIGYNPIVFDKKFNSDFKFIAFGDAKADSPFFPATTTTTTGDWLPARIITHDDLPDIEAFQAETRAKGFAPSYFLGAQSCQRCHADIVQQWSTSAHRFSSFNNPFYRKAVELTREKISKKSSQFCGGCHDPAIMLSGNMVRDIDPLTPESQAGLTCLACHAIDQVHGVVGNGNYNIQDFTESPYIFDQAKAGIGLEIHDYVLKAKPTVHKQRNLKPIFHKSEFCLTCHKVNLDVTVNDYRWLRGQNEYDAWHNSGIALNQPRTWYEPPTVRQCQDCHMPLEDAVLGDVAADEGKVRSHRFLSVNTALPALRGDSDTIERMETFMRDEKLRLEIFAVRRENGEVIMNAREHKIAVRPGELLQVDVVVRNLNVGHTFPGGTNDSNEGWIDFAVRDATQKVFHNGWVGPDRHVDPAAHFYKAVIVDRHSGRIAKRNASDIYATVYANVIGPSTSDIARYRFRVPNNASGDLTVSAKLMWRKFNREFTEFAFEGEQIPDLPITEIETDSISLALSDSPAPVVAVQPQPEDAKRWMRYNDYGIGSVLDGDTRSALAAFHKVVELQPEKMDGFLNQARAHLAEGSLAKAESMLREASNRSPNLPRLAFFWGELLEKKGDLTGAVEAYRRTLQFYPKSRDTWVRLGRVYWLKGEYPQSIEAFMEVLEIDPEHAQAYHQLNLAYKALAANSLSEEDATRYGALANEFQKGFEKYKLDEDSSAVTRRYREENSYDNLMSQAIIVHEEG